MSEYKNYLENHIKSIPDILSSKVQEGDGATFDLGEALKMP
jgi:hypothetical protein